ncbi:MAG: J domain-containing protein [Candidatus Methylumidiphilus sp.]
MPTTSDDFYEILQIHPKAEPEIIKAAYQRLAQKYHPDKNPGQAAAGLCMKKINEAHAVLGDPAQRAAYDRQAGTPPRPPPGNPAGGGNDYDWSGDVPDIHGWSGERAQAWQR